MRRALPVARTLPLATAFALTPRRPPVPAYYMPDFLVPPPVSPVATFSEELERLRATPEEQVRADVMRMLGSSDPPAALAELLEDAPRALGQLADALGAYWAEVIEPEWPRIRALLDADLAYRAQRLTTGGHASLFGDLNRLVRFSESRRELELITDATVGLRGQGLLLVPSVFQWERPAVIYDAPWQPTRLSSEWLTAREVLMESRDAARAYPEPARQLGRRPRRIERHEHLRSCAAEHAREEKKAMRALAALAAETVPGVF